MALPRIETAAETGLTGAQADERTRAGYANTPPSPPEKTTRGIIADNVFTYFNLIFIVLGIAVAAVGEYRDLTFVPVILFNTLIGIVQELRSRAELRKMRFVTESRAVVIRGGREVETTPDKTVLDDVAVLQKGCQIYADALVLGGECRVNEALVTGEADEIEKKAGDELLSGSFIVSGGVRARLVRVGRDSFVARLMTEAKKPGHKMRSEMMFALTRFVRTIGIVIIPFGAVMMYEGLKPLGNDLPEAVTTTTAALIGMIPEGLYLLVSVALTVSVMRLAKKRTLVHEMRCIETLARVDTLCVDKTGTITEPEMNVRGVVPLADGVTPESVAQTLADYLGGAEENETIAAMKSAFSLPPRSRAVSRLEFSSANKYAGAEFPGGRRYLFGAPDKMVRAGTPECEKARSYSEEGYRVLMLAECGCPLDAPDPCAEAVPVALVLLTNKIRESAVPAFKYFAEQGVSIRVISGDNPVTVSRIAQDAGIADAERYIDASTLTTQRNIRKAAGEYIVFGRVTPDMKRKLIRAMKADGHTVAMTGDGVNDVLALKDADVGIAMASGSEAASQVAQLVLLDSDFGAMPDVVREGRRVINNIERSSSLYLMKNIFSFTVALLAMILVEPFPLKPSQLTLFNVAFIGIPSFFLALEPNHARVRGRFIVNVLLSAAPAGIAVFAAWFIIRWLGAAQGFPEDATSVMNSYVISAVGLLLLIKISRPFNALRVALIIGMPALFVAAALIIPEFFGIVPLSARQTLITIGVGAAAAVVMTGLSIIAERLRRGHFERTELRGARKPRFAEKTV
jgi:cation-transporting ATPase E